MTPIRTKAMAILNAIPSGEMKSNDSSGLYQKYTGGLTHKRMTDDWAYRKEHKLPGQLTGCNEFVGWYARQLGSRWNLGRFDLVNYLPTIGKADSWVKSASGLKPQPGDILLHTAFHIDVALKFEGQVLTRVAAGQGGPKFGYDVLKRVVGNGDFTPANFQGWVDIDLFFKTSPMRSPVPPWLLGWWSVFDGNQYYYYFSAQQVTYTKTKPSNLSAPPAKGGLNYGNVTIIDHGLEILWNPVGGGQTKETFTRVGWTSETEMNGDSTRYAKLFARKMK